MRKIVFYILIVLAFSEEIFAANVENNNSINDYINTKIALRYYSMVRKYDEFVDESQNPYVKKRASNAIGGYIHIETKPLYHLSVGSTLYTSQPIFGNAKEEGGLKLLKDDQSGFSVLGEAYLEYKDRYNLFKIGRQRLSAYRFLTDSDSRMVPYTYEAAIVENRGLENIVLRAGAVHGVKTVASTTYIDFINASKDFLKEEVVDRNPIRGDYNPNNYDANGNYIGPRENLYLLSLVFSDKKMNFEVWDYLVPNFVNFFYTTLRYNFDYKKFSNSLSVQYLLQNDVGKHIAGDINTYAYGLQLNSRYENFHFTYSFSQVKYDENSLDGGSIIDTWGDDLIYGGLFYNGADQAGTIANAIMLNYDFQSYPIKITLAAGIYDLPNQMNKLFAGQDNSEYDFVLHYAPAWNKKLKFKVETLYIDFDTNYNYQIYEQLHGYDVLHTYDNILDMRFIVNYTF